jgi:hypothetical protein
VRLGAWSTPLSIWLWLSTQNALAAPVAEVFPFERNPDTEAQPPATLAAGAPWRGLRMRDGGSTPLTFGRGAQLHRTTFSVECWADGRASQEGAIPTACLALYARVSAALMADPYLGGLAESLDETGFAIESGDVPHTKPTRVLTATFAIEHEVRPGLTVRGREVVLAAVEAILRAPLPVVTDATRHEVVTQAFLATLATGLPGVTVRRHPVGQLGFDEVAVFDTEDEVTGAESYAVTRQATFRVAFPVTAATDDDTGDVAAARADLIRAALTPDPTLDGACDACVETETDDADVDGTGFHAPGLEQSLTYAADYVTDARNPTALPVWAQAA